MCVKTRLFDKLKTCDQETYFMQYTVYACAGVLAGIKPAELVRYTLRSETCAQCWQARKDELLGNLGLSCLELRKTQNSLLVLLYKPENLENVLATKIAKEILNGYGYESDTLKGILHHLKDRFSREEFPHEIGLFLGYPAADVKAFIQHAGREYIYCKYWKVYGDVERAKLLMARMDKAKHKAATMLTAGVKMPKLLRTMKAI